MSNSYQLINDCKTSLNELSNENVVLKIDDITLHFNEINHGIGTLFIAENRLVWLHNNDNKGFSFTYPSIVLHAISTDKNHFKDPCIYMQLAIEGDEEIPVVRFVPNSESDKSLDDIFKSLSEMASLHSDPISDSDEEQDCNGE